MIKGIYLNLMKEGWKIHEVDEMDMVWYMSLIAHTHKDNNQPQYIDQLGIF